MCLHIHVTRSLRAVSGRQAAQRMVGAHSPASLSQATPASDVFLPLTSERCGAETEPPEKRQPLFPGGLPCGRAVCAPAPRLPVPPVCQLHKPLPRRQTQIPRDCCASSPN